MFKLGHLSYCHQREKWVSSVEGHDCKEIESQKILVVMMQTLGRQMYSALQLTLRPKG